MSDPWADFNPVQPSGMISAGNIDLTNRPRVKNSDGSISTVRSIGVEMDGKEYLLPTVSDDGRILTEKGAIDLFKKTGKHLGVFDSPKASTAYAKSLHNDQAAMLEKSDPWADFQPAEKAPPRDPTIAPFPTPWETAKTMAGGAVRAIPKMVTGTAGLAWDATKMASGYQSDEDRAAMQQHIRGAMDPNAPVGTRISEGVEAVPIVGPMANGIYRGAKTILKPVADATAGVLIPNPDVNVGTITPEEMSAAADTGGAAVANLAAPKLIEGASNISAATVGRVLKSTAKTAVSAAVHPAATVAGKVVEAFVFGPLMKAAGTIAQDALLEALRKGDLVKAAETVAKVAEKNPEAAASIAEIAKAEAAAQAPATTPQAAAPAVAKPLPSMRDVTPEAIAARTAERVARQQAALAKSKAPVVPEAVAAQEAVQTPSAPVVEPPSQAVAVAPITESPAPSRSVGRKPLIRVDQRAIVGDARPVWQPVAGKKAWILETPDGDMLRGVPDKQWTVGKPHKFESAQAAVEFQKRAMGKVPAVSVPAPVVEQAVKTLGNRAQMPVEGNVTMPSVSTKPKGSEPAGKPLTPKQREMRMKQLELARAAGLDIWEAFGVAKED